MITKKEKYDINTIYDLTNHRVAYQTNNVYIGKLDDVQNIDLVAENDGNHLYYMLMTGQVNAIVYHVQPIMGLAETMGMENRLKVLSPSLYESVRAIGVSQDYPELYQMLNKELTKYMQTPEYKALFKKWHEGHIPYWNKRRTYMLFSVIFTITVAFLVFWRLMTCIRKIPSSKPLQKGWRIQRDNFKHLLWHQTTS